MSVRQASSSSIGNKSKPGRDSKVLSERAKSALAKADDIRAHARTFNENSRIWALGVFTRYEDERAMNPLLDGGLKTVADLAIELKYSPAHKHKDASTLAAAAQEEYDRLIAAREAGENYDGLVKSWTQLAYEERRKHRDFANEKRREEIKARDKWIEQLSKEAENAEEAEREEREERKKERKKKQKRKTRHRFKSQRTRRGITQRAQVLQAASRKLRQS